MFPENGRYLCRQCGAEKEFGDAEVFSKKAIGKDEVEVMREDAASYPKTKITCDKCGNNEAYFTLKQTRAADEPETRIYRCTKCHHSWREY